MRRAALLFISYDWWIDHIGPSHIFGSSVIASGEVRQLLKEYGVQDHALVWLKRWAEKCEFNAIQFLFSSEEHMTTLPFCADGCRPMNVSVLELNEMCLRGPSIIPAPLNCRCSFAPIAEMHAVGSRIFPVKRGRIIERVES